MNCLLAEVMACYRIHIMPRRNAVQDIRLKHGVELHAAQRNVVASENMCIILEVMPDFLLVIVLKPAAHLAQNLVARKLSRCSRIVMGDWNIGGFACFDCQRQAD